MDATAAVLVVGIAIVAILSAVGLFWGLVYGWIWARVHGPDRTRQASRMLVLAVVCVQLLTVGLTVAILPDDGTAPFALGAFALALVPYTLAVFLVLRRAVPGVEAVASPPSLVLPDHDGVSFEVSSHAAVGSAIVTAAAVAMPLPLAFGALAWSRHFTRTPVRIRNDAVDVDGQQLPLHGARLVDAVRWDGTPVLRIAADGRAADIPLGGTPTGEVRWVRETLDAAIRGAEDTRLPPEPEALRRLAARVQQ